MDRINRKSRQASIAAGHNLLSTLTISADYAQSAKICALCAELQIKGCSPSYARGEEPLLTTEVAQHTFRQKYKDTYPTFPAMAQRGLDGCTFCTFLRTSLLLENRKRNRSTDCEERVVHIALKASMTEHEQDQSALSMYNDRAPRTIKVRVSYIDIGRAPFLEYNISFQLSSEVSVTQKFPLSAGNINTITQWLQECDEKHSNCTAVSTDLYPARLLAVKDDELRIVTEEVEHHRYAALSYCWGGLSKEQMSFVTTTNNIASRLSGFPLNALPRTLKDAVRTVRALQIEFIWIDAICIIQDDANDWSKEASKMDKIYRRAYFTIAATNSKSSFDGFLRHREPSCRASLDFTFEEKKPYRSQTTRNETGSIHFRYPLDKSVEKHLSTCKWNKRGWTLQERLLSTRILYFTEEVIYYECRSSQRVESPGYKLPEVLTVPVSLTKSTQTEKTTTREEDYSTWYRIVDMYSFRDLTFPGDKLPAMEGLAKAFKEVLDDDYVFGLWKLDLYRGLLWSGGGMPCQFPIGGYRAPTWSWASRDKRVCWDISTIKRKWKSLIEVSTISPTQTCGHSNQTTGAQLEIVALIAPLKDVLLAYDPPEEHGWDYSFPDEMSNLDGYYERERFYMDSDDFKPVPLTHTRMVLIAERTETENIQGILVQSTGISDSFRRVGWFIHNESRNNLDEEDSPDESFECVRKVFRTEKITLV